MWLQKIMNFIFQLYETIPPTILVLVWFIWLVCMHYYFKSNILWKWIVIVLFIIQSILLFVYIELNFLPLVIWIIFLSLTYWLITSNPQQKEFIKKVNKLLIWISIIIAWAFILIFSWDIFWKAILSLIIQLLPIPLFFIFLSKIAWECIWSMR